MERDVWKWIFSRLSDKSLVHITCGINEMLSPKRRIGIKGIADLKKIKDENIRLFRSRLETEINKQQNTNKAKDFLRKHTKEISKNVEVIMAISEKESDGIWTEIQYSETVKINEMIMFLMIQTDPIQINKGVQLYERFIKEHVKDSTTMESMIETQYRREIGPVLNEEECRNLQAEIEGLRTDNIKLREENKQLQEEKKEAIKTSKKLKRIIDQSESNKNEAQKDLQKLEREIEARRDEVSTRDRKNQELQEALKRLKEAETQLKKDNEKLVHDKNILKEEKNAIELNIAVENQKQMIPKRAITIIDRQLPNGLDTHESVSVSLIQPTQLDQMILTNKLDLTDEIWFIKFRLSIPRQNILNEKYGTKVTGFSTYNELKAYYNGHY